MEMRKVSAKFAGTVSGFASPEETDEQAIARLLLDAEMSVNKEQRVRLHLECDDLKMVDIPKLKL
jgi:hypothetical protein